MNPGGPPTSEVEDTGEKQLEPVQDSPAEEQKPPEKKEEKITRCPEDVPSALFSCLATMTDCERLQLTKDEAQRMSEAITQLFGRHIGGWMWWLLVLIVLIFGKVSHAWKCLTRKEKKEEKSQSREKEGTKPPGQESKAKAEHSEKEEKDLVEVVQNGKIIQVPRKEAIERGLIKQAEET
jgi:hypothetical protein